VAGSRVPAGVRAAKALQLRSRIAQGLNVPTAYVSASRSLRPCWTRFFTHPLRSYLFVRSNSLITCSVRSIVSLL